MNCIPSHRILLLAVVLALASCGGDTRVSKPAGKAPPRVAPSMQRAATPSTLSRSATRPNLILIMTDDQALGDMRAMPLVKQHIGAQGVTFTNSFASWPLCCPSRATLFTGQYAHNHRVLGNYPPAGSSQAFTDDSETLPVWLQRAGYATVHIGKYLNGYGADNRGIFYVPPGWTQWMGAVDPSTYRMWGYTLNHDGTHRNYGKPDDEDPALYQTDVFRGLALAEIERFAQGTQPFFLSFAVLAPHEERDENPSERHGFPGPRPAPRHKGTFAGVQLPRPPNFDRLTGGKPKVVGDFGRVFAGETIDQRTSRYRRRLESLRAVDEAVEAIVAKLAELWLLDNTVIVFTSDNGFFNGEHGIPVSKFLMYEPSLRVPLLIRGPGIPAGRVSDELVANVDLAPTFVELAAAKARRVMDGRSMLAYARDPGLRSMRPILLDAPQSQVIQASRTGKGPPVEIPTLRGLRTQRYSYVEYGTGEVELYNMVEDPDQLRSYHNDPAYQTVDKAMRSALSRYAVCAGDSCRADILAVHQQENPTAAPPKRRSRSPARKARAR